MKRSIHLSPVSPLAPIIEEGELVAFNVDPDGVAYLVVALKPLDYRLELPGWASFAKTVPERPGLGAATHCRGQVSATFSRSRVLYRP